MILIIKFLIVLFIKIWLIKNGVNIIDKLKEFLLYIVYFVCFEVFSQDIKTTFQLWNFEKYNKNDIYEFLNRNNIILIAFC